MTIRRTTPGPWEWRANMLCAPALGTTLLRDVIFWNQDPGDNGLIAAAPELLEYVRSSAEAGCATARLLVARIDGELTPDRIPYAEKCKRRRSDGPTPCLCCPWECVG